MSWTLAPQWVDWVHAVGWTLLHFCWQGALVGAGYALLRWAFAKSRPQARYTLGLASLGVLLGIIFAAIGGGRLYLAMRRPA